MDSHTTLTDFWDLAFGGKNNLRLMLEARDFRLRKNKKSTTASFNYSGGRVVINILHLKEHDYYTVCRYDKEGKTRADLDDWLTTPSIEWVSECVEDLTGKVLSF
jgi:hypothetical protein